MRLVTTLLALAVAASSLAAQPKPATPPSKPAAPTTKPAAPTSKPAATSQPAAPATKAAAAAVIDINSATAAELQAVPGIGASYAAKIIAGRPYKAKDELTRKHVLPAGVYAKVKDRLVAKQS